jgi:hypothetical protein
MGNVIVNPGFETNNGIITTTGWHNFAGLGVPVAGSPYSGSWCAAVPITDFAETIDGGSETTWEYNVATVTRCDLFYKSLVACHVALIFDNHTQQRNVILPVASGWTFVNLLSQVHAYAGHKLDAILLYNDDVSGTAFWDDVFVSITASDAVATGASGATGAGMNVRAIMFFWLIAGLGELRNTTPRTLDQRISRALERPRRE